MSTAPTPGLSPEQLAEIEAIVADGEMIEAIKRYRELTGASLATAKRDVDRLRPGLSLGEEAGAALEFAEELEELLRQGKKIEAIKRYREGTGAGLRDAKEAVDVLDRELRATSSADDFASPAVQRGGCASAILLVLLPFGSLAIQGIY